MKSPGIRIGDETLTRKRVRELCKSYPGGLYYFAKAVCGFGRMKEHLHLPFCNYIQLHPWNDGPERSNRKHAWMPREHFKSTICSVAFPLWLLSCHDRNATIALISAHSDNTKKWLRQIKNIIEHNGFFRWAFPEIRPGGKWDEEEIVITRDQSVSGDAQASITAYSINSGLASQHHSYIILDDPVNEQVAKSDVEMAKAVSLFVHLEEILKGWKESGFLLVDTPWGREDVHHAALGEERRGYRLKWGIGVLGDFEISASLKSRDELLPQVTPGKPILPTECDEDKLQHISQQPGGVEKLHMQYYCKPFDSGRNGFALDLIRDFAIFPDGMLKCDCHSSHNHHLRLASVCAVSDPAYTEDKKNCESAIQIGAKFPCECRFLLAEWGGHVITTEYINQACAMAAEWKTWLRAYGVEEVNFQIALKNWLTERKEQNKFPLGCQLEGLRPKRREKDTRIASQVYPVSQGWWHKRPTMRQIPGHNNLMQQLFQWPFSRLRDRADTFGYWDDIWEIYPPRGEKQTEKGENVNARREQKDMEMFKQEVLNG